jgi:epoxyqueuosine reductase
MSAGDFRERVMNSSIGWIRRTRIRRNAAIAAGNMRCEQAVAALTEMLNDENPILREHAAWALHEITKTR